VNQWRGISIPSAWGVTPETARLLQHWRHHEFGGVRPFFCQIEAVETVIWLTEVAPNERQGKGFLEHLVNANNDANPELMRLALKMATGAGKTTVMAMLIAWQTVNAVRRPQSKRFTRGFLVVTPGITIKDRLRVLYPNDPDSYYASRELVPSDMLEDVKKAKIVIPREADLKWPDIASTVHADWWQARIARQKEIDASIAAKAEFEYLYDKPYPDNRKVRVAGPFTVESLSPHRVLGVDENDELIDQTAEPGAEYAARQTFPQMILENLRIAGVQQAHKDARITFTALTPWPGDLVTAEGRYMEGEGAAAVERRAAIFIGPEFGTVTRPDLVLAAREAGDAAFDVLIACAFNYEAHATEFSKLGRIPVLKARMHA